MWLYFGVKHKASLPQSAVICALVLSGSLWMTAQAYLATSEKPKVIEATLTFQASMIFSNMEGPSSQSYGFTTSRVWMWQVDHKVEHQRIDAFELWNWRRLLRVPWTARSSNKSILKEMSPEYSLEGLLLKLNGWMASPTQWTWVSASSGSWWRTGKPGTLQSMGSQRVRHNWVAELNWSVPSAI